MFYIVEWKQEPVSEYKGLADAENEQNKYPFSIVNSPILFHTPATKYGYCKLNLTIGFSFQTVCMQMHFGVKQIQ